jgi:2-keto-myo-inositol isomerase
VTTHYRYALNTSTIRECGELSVPEKISITAEAGYDGIELWIKELDQFVAQGGTLADLRTQIVDQGLQPVNLIGFFEWCAPDDDTRRQGLEEARRNPDGNTRAYWPMSSTCTRAAASFTAST